MSEERTIHLTPKEFNDWMKQKYQEGYKKGQCDKTKELQPQSEARPCIY